MYRYTQEKRRPKRGKAPDHDSDISPSRLGHLWDSTAQGRRAAVPTQRAQHPDKTAKRVKSSKKYLYSLYISQRVKSSNMLHLLTTIFLVAQRPIPTLCSASTCLMIIHSFFSPLSFCPQTLLVHITKKKSIAGKLQQT